MRKIRIFVGTLHFRRFTEDCAAKTRANTGSVREERREEGRLEFQFLNQKH